MLHGLRIVKGRVYLLVSSRVECCVYIIPSLSEGVLVDEGIKDTARAGIWAIGSGKWLGACGTGRCR